MPRRSSRPPLTLRTLVLLLAAVLTGIGAGMLTYLGGQNAALAVLGGVAAAAAALKALDSLVDTQ